LLTLYCATQTKKTVHQIAFGQLTVSTAFAIGSQVSTWPVIIDDVPRLWLKWWWQTMLASVFVN